MDSSSPQVENGWDQQDSQIFIDYGRYFVPERERQLEVMVDLLPFDHDHEAATIMELCCGEGLLAEALLERFPACTVLGLDGSAEMLKHASARVARFGGRFEGEWFELSAKGWREAKEPIHAALSSLAIHHLDGAQKQELFADLFGMLAPGGVFIIADLVEPAHRLGWQLAAKEWDRIVQERAMELDGSLDAFAFFEREKWNMYRYFDPQDIDKPSRLFDQLKWLAQAGFVDVDVYWMRAGHAIFGGRRPSPPNRWRVSQLSQSGGGR